MEIIETILVKIKNEEFKIENYFYHLNRVKNTCKYYRWKFDEKEWKNLKNEKLQVKNENLRIRVIYNYNGIKNIEYFPVKKRKFKTFKVVNSNINYHFKYAKRENLNSLKPKNVDEIIIIKNNLVTDTTISNLAFFDGKEWLTPKYPLLKGTKREELIQKGFLKEANIHKYDLKYFKKMAMINAILEFYEIKDYDIIF